MFNARVWHKLLLIVLILIIPIAVLGYLAISSQYQRLNGERRRLAGLEYLQGIRNFVEHVQQFRTAAVAFRAGDKSFQEKIGLAAAEVEKNVVTLDALSLKRNPSLRAKEEWDAVRDKWEEVRQAFVSQKPEQVNRENADLLAKTATLVAHVADTSGLIFVPDARRYYLFDSLLSQLLPQSDLLGQAQALATAAAVRKTVNEKEKIELIEIASQIKSLRSRIATNAENAWGSADDMPEQIADLVQANKIEGDKVIKYVNDNILGSARIDASPEGVTKAASNAVKNAFDLFDQEFAAAIELTQKQIAVISKGLQLAVFSVAAALLLGIVLTVLISRSLTRQISITTDVFSHIERGDYQARARVVSKDEIGQMTASLNRMLDKVLAFVQSQEERDRIQNSIMRLLDEVSGVAEGDLTIKADDNDEVTGALADSFNYMIEQLRSIIGYVQDASTQVTTSALQLQAMAEHLAHGSDAQANQIGTTSQSLEEMAVAVRQVSENATQSATVAQQALASAKKGSTSVQDTIEGMNRIRDQVQETAKRIKRLGESTQEIGTILQLIDDLADRTSILALNAAIQASLAGEAGRGFALVAEEVERLAERSTDATKKIAGLVKTIQGEAKEAVTAMEETTREVVGGSKLADGAGQTLIEIESVSLRLSELIQAISMASRQQAKGSDGLSRAMTQISQVTQQNAAETKQAADAVASLAVTADDLRRSVSTFRVPQTGAEHADGADHGEEMNGRTEMIGIPATPHADDDNHATTTTTFQFSGAGPK